MTSQTTVNSKEKKTIQTNGGEVLVVSSFSDSDEKEITELYKHSQILSQATPENASKHVSSYNAILEAVKGSKRAKILAGQLIPKYLPLFPNFVETAINAQLDLCEEDDREIRINAIRGFPLLCKQSTAHVSQIANVLGQLLLEDDALGLDAVKRAFISLLRIDIKGS